MKCSDSKSRLLRLDLRDSSHLSTQDFSEDPVRYPRASPLPFQIPPNLLLREVHAALYMRPHDNGTICPFGITSPVLQKFLHDARRISVTRPLLVSLEIPIFCRYFRCFGSGTPTFTSCSFLDPHKWPCLEPETLRASSGGCKDYYETGVQNTNTTNAIIGTLMTPPPIPHSPGARRQGFWDCEAGRPPRNPPKTPKNSKAYKAKWGFWKSGKSVEHRSRVGQEFLLVLQKPSFDLLSGFPENPTMTYFLPTLIF